MSPNPNPSDSAHLQQENDEPTVDHMIGQRIGNFQVEERLGAGAMASVYRASDTTTGQPVALKVLNAAADEILRERFRMEARTVRALQHPHIVHTIASGQTDQGTTYIAMEVVEGENLGTLLEKRHQLTVLDSCHLLQPIAAALAHAHAAGVIHRDVKPGNILLRRVAQGTPHSVDVTGMTDAVIPLLSDFGIARAVDAPELTTLGRTIGTPAFMSPEQCSGQRLLDGRADIYSLGAVLYRCLVGRTPFVGATTQILHAHVYEALTIPDNIWRILPPSMVTILRKSLQKEPDDRYVDAAALASDLLLMVQESTPADATATMPSLPVANPADSIIQVLVPGLAEKSSEPPIIPWIPPDDSIVPPTRTMPRRSFMRRKRPSTNWAVVLLGILLSVGVLLLGFVTVTTLAPQFRVALGLPGIATSSEATVDITPALTPLAGNLPPDTIAPADLPLTTPADATSDSGAASAPDLRPSPNLPAPTADLTEMADPATTTTASLLIPEFNALAGGPLSSTITATTTLLNDIDVAKTWQDVQHYYQSGEWGQARWAMMTMLSAKEGVPGLSSNNLFPLRQVEAINDRLLNVPSAIYWGKWIDVFTYGEVGQFLADIYISLAQEELLRTEDLSALSKQTTDYLLAAGGVKSTSTLVRNLSAITSRFLADDGSQREVLGNELVDIYLAYAQERYTAGAICAAAHTLSTAERLQPGEIDAQLAVQYQNDCEGTATIIAETATPTPPLNVSGTLYYSSEAEDGRYSIWRVPVGQPEAATLFVQNGAQPSLYQNQMAFYSRRSDSEGLSGFSLTEPFNADQLFRRYTGGVEDARESPARWNPMGTSLVFASTDGGDNKSRVYVVPAEYNNNGVRDELGLGEDPVWSPDGTEILYRDTGESGNTPGLVIRSADGLTSRRLTAAEDRRPIWTADGRYIIFMRRVDALNWELFRLSLSDGQLVQLTDNPAQDGLPVLSPDGNTILFASDRGADWHLWTIALDESELRDGEARLLMPIQGKFLLWLEHSIQWVN